LNFHANLIADPDESYHFASSTSQTSIVDQDSDPTYSRGYKKRAIAEKMFGTLAIFSESLQGYFSTFFFILVSEDS
jgi:hypothetical protein